MSVTHARRGKRIRTLSQLFAAALARKAVVWPPMHNRMPAAWLINMPGTVLNRALTDGVWLYIPKKERQK